jgi:hypothetical protein
MMNKNLFKLVTALALILASEAMATHNDNNALAEPRAQAAPVVVAVAPDARLQAPAVQTFELRHIVPADAPKLAAIVTDAPTLAKLLACGNKCPIDDRPSYGRRLLHILENTPTNQRPDMIKALLKYDDIPKYIIEDLYQDLYQKKPADRVSVTTKFLEVHILAYKSYEEIRIRNADRLRIEQADGERRVAIMRAQSAQEAIDRADAAAARADELQVIELRREAEHMSEELPQEGTWREQFMAFCLRILDFRKNAIKQVLEERNKKLTDMPATFFSGLKVLCLNRVRQHLDILKQQVEAPLLAEYADRIRAEYNEQVQYLIRNLKELTDERMRFEIERPREAVAHAPLNNITDDEFIHFVARNKYLQNLDMSLCTELIPNTVFMSLLSLRELRVLVANRGLFVDEDLPLIRNVCPWITDINLVDLPQAGDEQGDGGGDAAHAYAYASRLDMRVIYAQIAREVQGRISEQLRRDEEEKIKRFLLKNQEEFISKHHLTYSQQLAEEVQNLERQLWELDTYEYQNEPLADNTERKASVAHNLQLELAVLDAIRQDRKSIYYKIYRNAIKVRLAVIEQELASQRAYRTNYAYAH